MAAFPSSDVVTTLSGSGMPLGQKAQGVDTTLGATGASVVDMLTAAVGGRLSVPTIGVASILPDVVGVGVGSRFPGIVG